MRKRSVSSREHLSGIALSVPLAAFRIQPYRTYIGRAAQRLSQDTARSSQAKHSRIGSEVKEELNEN